MYNGSLHAEVVRVRHTELVSAAENRRAIALATIAADTEPEPRGPRARRLTCVLLRHRPAICGRPACQCV